MACFDNLIGLKGSCTEQTLSSGGLFLNSLGVNRDFVENIVNDDYDSVDAFVLDKIALSQDQLINDIYSNFTSKFNVKSILEGARIGQYNQTPSIIPAIPLSMKGVQVKIWNDTTFVKLYISTIKTYLSYTGSVTLYVYDLTQGLVIDTIVIQSLNGAVVETVVNKVYDSPSSDLNLAILYDASTFGSYATSFLNSGCSTCSRGGAFMQNKFVYSNGVTILSASPKTQSFINSTSDLGGISLVYSLQCDHSKWICSNANFFTSAMLYKTAYLITQYADLMSNTFSSSNVDKEKLRERMEYYEFEYKNRLDAGVKNLKIPQGDGCFSCNRLRMNKTILPS